MSFRTDANASNELGKARYVVYLIIIAAVIFRIANAGLNPVTHTNVLMDEARVNVIAKNLAETGEFAYSEGFGRSDKTLVNALSTPPVTIYSLAFIFKLFGAGYAQERIFTGLVSMLVVLLLFLIGRKVYSTGTGVLAAAILSLHPLFLFYSRVALHDMLSYFFFLFAIYLLFRYDENEHKMLFLYIGIFAGLSTLSRYNGILALLFISAFLLLFRRKNLMKNVLMMSAGACAVFVTWLLIAYSYGQEFLAHFLSSFLLELSLGSMVSSEGTALLKTVIFYYPFIVPAAVVSLFYIAIKKEKLTKQVNENLILIWILLGFLWWVQSSHTGKYSLIFGIPLTLFAANQIVGFYDKYRALILMFLFLMFGFYLVWDYADVVSDFRSDAVYEVAELIEENENAKFYFHEPEITFLSGYSLFPSCWAKSERYPIGYMRGCENLYASFVNLSAREYLDESPPDYIILSDVTRYIGRTPRAELREYVSEFGILYRDIPPYKIYRINKEKLVPPA